MAFHATGDDEMNVEQREWWTTLTSWNSCAVVVLAINLIGLICFAAITDAQRFMPVTDTYPTGQPGTNFTQSSVNVLFHSQPVILSIVFVAVSLCAHLYFLYLGHEYWEECVLKARNPYRWLEYAISSTVMIVQLVWLNGMTDIRFFMNAGAANVAMILFGDLNERINTFDSFQIPVEDRFQEINGKEKRIKKKDTDKPKKRKRKVDEESGEGEDEGSGLYKFRETYYDEKSEAKKTARTERFEFQRSYRAFVYGCFPWLGPWVSIFYTIGRASAHVPAIVYVMTIWTFVQFSGFAVVALWQTHQSRPDWKQQYRFERWYIVLSLTSKTALAWLAVIATR